MNIPPHARPKRMTTIELSPMELGALTRAVLSGLGVVGGGIDQEYRATLLTLRDRFIKLSESFTGHRNEPG